jgi:internalin A
VALEYPQKTIWYVRSSTLNGAEVSEGSAVAVRLQKRGEPKTAKTYLLTCGHVVRGSSARKRAIRAWAPDTGYNDEQASDVEVHADFKKLPTGELSPEERRNAADDWVILEIHDAQAAMAAPRVEKWVDPTLSGSFRICGYMGGKDSFLRGKVHPTLTPDAFPFRDAWDGAVYLTGQGTRPGISGGGVFGETDLNFAGIHRARSDDTLQLCAVSSFHIRERLYELGYEVVERGEANRRVAVGPAEGSDSAESPISRRDRLADYLKCVRDAHHAITFLGLPTLMENPYVGIDHLFVEPALATQPADPDRDPKDWVGVAPLSDTVADRCRLVILGEPGTGKSTLVSWIAYQLASDTPNPWQSRLNKAIPLPFLLRDLDIGRDITWDGLVDAFLAVSAHHLLSEEQLAHVLEDGSAVLLLDGLDEIGDGATRRRLRAAVQGGLRRYPNCRWLLTSRIAGYAEVPFHLTEEAEEARRNDQRAIVEELLDVRYVVPFDDARIEHFARKWCDTQERGTDQAPVVKRKTRELAEAVRRDGDTLRLARIPNLLTMMALVHPGKAEFPHGKALLYDYVAEAYLESIDRFRHGLAANPNPLRDKKRWLGRVAFEMQIRKATTDVFGRYLEEQSNAIVATRDAILGWLRAAMEKLGKPLDPDDPGRFLDRVWKRNGLMIERAPDQLAFTHLSFQDYFAAVYLHESVTSAKWILGEKEAFAAAAASDETLLQRYHWYGVYGEPYAGNVAAGTSSEFLRRYTHKTAWHATLVFLFELIADGSPLGKKLLREAIFGPGWELGGLNPNTVELAVRYVRNRVSNYSPLTKGGYRGVLGRGDPAGLGRKITPPTPPSQGGDEFAISTATVG